MGAHGRPPDDRNAIDTALELAGGGDTTGLQLVVSKPPRVEGRVVTRDGEPAPDSTIVIFASEPGKWTIASRFIRAGRPDSAGRFSFAGLPTGTYRAAARDFVAEGQWEDPEFLTGLAASAASFTLTENAAEL